MFAKDVLTEEWLADVLQDSLEMDWTSTDGARAIMRALEAGAIKLPPILSEDLRGIMARLPAAPWRVVRSLLDGFGASLEVDNGSNFGNIGHIRDYDTACALADLVREVVALPSASVGGEREAVYDRDGEIEGSSVSFINERGRLIRVAVISRDGYVKILVEGPDSISENVVTPMEAGVIHSELTTVLATPETPPTEGEV